VALTIPRSLTTRVTLLSEPRLPLIWASQPCVTIRLLGAHITADLAAMLAMFPNRSLAGKKEQRAFLNGGDEIRDRPARRRQRDAGGAQPILRRLAGAVIVSMMLRP